MGALFGGTVGLIENAARHVPRTHGMTRKSPRVSNKPRVRDFVLKQVNYIFSDLGNVFFKNMWENFFGTCFSYISFLSNIFRTSFSKFDR